jgi:putative phosphoesterase
VKIAVVSDTHRTRSAIIKVCAILQRENPDLVIHLGDVMEDADAMEDILHREVRRVPGNCDFSLKEPSELLLIVEGFRILVVHGHHHRVKRGLRDLASDAKRKGADIVLYGHTHVAQEDEISGVQLFNPGSAALPKGGQKASFAMMDLKGKEVSVRFVHVG